MKNESVKEIKDHSTGQSSTPIVNDSQYDNTMDSYLVYEEFMNQGNSYRSAA